MKNVAIIGGGASGFIAAIKAAESGASVTVFEKNSRVLKKLLATGNGRCNISNRFCTSDRYHGNNVDFILPAMEKFDTEKFFFDIGIPFCELENGKLYPRSLQASAVLDMLRLKAEELGVNVVCDCEINKIKEGFLLNDTFKADAVIIAAGGEASAPLGGTDSGYKLLKALGHRITKRLPSIVQLKTDVSLTKAMSGLKMDMKVKLLVGKKELASDFGEVLFTDYGLSGPPVLQISGTASRHLDMGEKIFVSLDLMPDMEEKKLFFFLKNRCYTNPERKLEDFLTGVLPKRIAQCMLKASGLAPLSRIASLLDDEDLKSLSHTLKNFKLEVLDTNGMKNAQVTIGGADTSEFDPKTMESKLIKNLFACGEVLDIDGDCGGFNLQWAWASGYLAGENASK